MKIVVRGTNWIGDAVMTIPALRRLRSSFPEAAISLHTRSWAEGIFRDCDFLDEIIPIEKGSSPAARLFRESRTLNIRRFDLAVLLPNSFESALTIRLAGIRKRCGYNTDSRGFLLTDKYAVPEWKGERHEAFYYLNLVGNVEQDLLGTTANNDELPSAKIDVSETRRNQARNFLVENGVDLSLPVVAFGTGSTNSLAKRWPAENFGKLADSLTGEPGANVVLVGSREEEKVSSDVSRAAKSKIIDLTGKTDLAAATALLSEIDLFISNDMGLAHVAAAVGTNTIVIFGPTNENTTRPLGENVAVIREHVECSPCMLRTCPIDHRCMTRITPERVLATAAEMLQTVPNRR